MSAPPNLPRRRITRRRVVAAIVILVVFGIVGVTWKRRAELAGVYARLDRDDPGWRWADLAAARPAVSPDRDCETQVRRLAALPHTGSSNDADMLGQLAAPNLRCNAVQKAALGRLLPISPELPILIAELAARPEGRFVRDPAKELLSDILDHCQYRRSAAEAVKWYLEDRLEYGTAEEITTAWIALWNLSLSIADEHLFICELFRHMIESTAFVKLERVLALAELSDDQLLRIRAALEMAESESALAELIRGERAYVDLYYAEPSRAPQMPTKASGPFAFITVLRERLDHYFLNAELPRGEALKLFSDALEMARRPEDARLPADWQAWEKRVGAPSSLHLQAAQAVTRSLAVVPRSVAKRRIARSAVAAERFRVAHERWPIDLSELVTAGLLAAVPTDPYDGRPLRSVARDGRFDIYSIGEDAADDGGTIGTGSGKRTGEDVVFRLWPPGQRRQPQPVKPAE